MKKKVIAIAGVLVVAALVAFAMLGGKSDKKPAPDNKETESTTIVEEITASNKNVVDITELKEDEFVALTWEQVRDFAEDRLPNYREIYGINKDTEMNQAEWEKLKKIMFWQLFDQTYDSYIKVGNVSSDVEVETNIWGADIVYVEPSKEFIDGLSTKEFRDYMKGFLNFAEAGAEAVAAIDSLTDEQVEEMRVEFTKEYCSE